MKLPRAHYGGVRGQSVGFFKENGLTLVEAGKRLSLPKGMLKNDVSILNVRGFSTQDHRKK